MNKFKIKKEFSPSYIEVWKDAKVRVDDVDGFIDFKFLKLDKESENYDIFASYALWENKEKFLTWMGSEHFKISHSTGPKNSEMYMEKPTLECFEIIHMD